MAASRVSYIGDGATAQYSIPFPYISTQHVFARVNGIQQLAADVSVVGSTLLFSTPPSTGDIIEIYRQTSPDSRLVDYTPGAQLAEADLDTDSIQAFYLAQENRDNFDGVISQALQTAAAAAAPGGTGGSAQEILDGVIADVLASPLLAELQQRISDIDLNAETILDQEDRLVDLQAAVDLLGGGGNVAAIIAAEETARINGDNALAQILSLVGAVNPGGTAFVFDATTAEVSPGESLANRLTGLRADVDDNVAAIVAEANARANGDSANASAISALSARVGTNEAAVAVTASALVDTQGDVTNLEARYTVKVDVNGYVAGYGLAVTENNGVPTSEFIVLADRFAIVHPGDTPVVPFVVTGGVTYLQNVVVGGALIDNLDAGVINGGTITANIGISTGSLNITSTGKIYSGKSTFASTVAGWFLGRDAGVPKFKIGDANNWLAWDGAALVVNGAILTNVDSVFLQPTTVSSFNVAPGHAISQFTVGNDRILRRTQTPNGFTNEDIGQWLGNGHASYYECRMNVISGSFSSGSTGVWLDCATSRTWKVSVETGAPGLKQTVGQLSIRRKSDNTVLAQADITFSAQVS